MLLIGVSGDGDTARSARPVRAPCAPQRPAGLHHREQRLYGLTKGQFSATADVGSTIKGGVVNDLPPIDFCAIAIELGCGVRGALVLGRQEAVLSLLKAAFGHKGTAVLDVISPCVTFNDHEGSTKSYAYAKDHDAPLHEISFVPYFEDITVDYEPGITTEVRLHDGSRRRLASSRATTRPTRPAIRPLQESARRGEFLTGVLSSSLTRTTSSALSTSGTCRWPCPAGACGRQGGLDEIMEAVGGSDDGFPGSQGPKVPGFRAIPGASLRVSYNRPAMERTFAIVNQMRCAAASAASSHASNRLDSPSSPCGCPPDQARGRGFLRGAPRAPVLRSLTDFMSSGPCVVLCLEAPDAIKKWRTLMGATDPAKADPGTLRRNSARRSKQRDSRVGRPRHGRLRSRLLLPGLEL